MQLFSIQAIRSVHIDEVIGATLAAYGSPYGLVNNASIYTRGSILDMLVATFERTFKVDLTSMHA